MTYNVSMGTLNPTIPIQFDFYGIIRSYYQFVILLT